MIEPRIENGVYADPEVTVTSRAFVERDYYTPRIETSETRKAEEAAWAARSGPVRIIHPAVRPSTRRRPRRFTR